MLPLAFKFKQSHLSPNGESYGLEIQAALDKTTLVRVENQLSNLSGIIHSILCDCYGIKASRRMSKYL